MRVLSLALLVGIFMGMPLWLLNTMVMPELETLRNTYSHLDEIAAKAVE
jgi:hypothetical protein